MKIKILVSVLMLSGVLISCHKNSTERYKVQSPKSKIDVTIHRFDKDMITLDTLHPLASVKELYEKYPDFLPLFAYNILEVDDIDTAKVAEMLLKFDTDTAFTNVNKKVLETFNNVNDIEKELSSAFSLTHEYFPQIILPQVYFFTSGFNRSVMMTDSIMAIGTDFYLGGDYKPYQDFSYDYLLYNMRKDMVSIDIESALLFKSFIFNGAQDRLLDNMLHRGKVIYLVATFMPDKKIEDILGYSSEQMKWAEKYEEDIWKTIVGQKDLFSTDIKIIGQYLNEAPFTTPVSQESPGRLGVYMGWRIVNSYMKNNKNVTLQQLMEMNNYQKMLEQSGYKP